MVYKAKCPSGVQSVSRPCLGCRRRRRAAHDDAEQREHDARLTAAVGAGGAAQAAAGREAGEPPARAGRHRAEAAQVTTLSSIYCLLYLALLH